MKRKLLFVFGIICTCIFMLSGCSNKASEPTPTPTPTSTTSVSTMTTPKPSPSAESNSFLNASVGDKIDFGIYDNEPIIWRVLDKQDGKVLLISEYTLENKEYNETLTKTTWKECTLRAYLNGEFYNNCFNSEERLKIVTTHVINSDNPDYGTSGGDDTDDKIFLLSIDEFNKYFSSDDERRCWGINGSICSHYWLRSIGWNSKYAAFVYSDGNTNIMSQEGIEVNSRNYAAVRPALWVNYGS